MNSPPALDHHPSPLSLDPAWVGAPPLIALEEALSRDQQASGLSRPQFTRRLLARLPHASLIPILWLLPRPWRLAPDELPESLRGLAMLLRDQLLSPLLLASLFDELAHLLPPAARAQPSALERWRGSPVALPDSIAALLAEAALVPSRSAPRPPLPPPAGDSLVWHTTGLPAGPSPRQGQANRLLAQVLNRLGARLDAAAPLRGDGAGRFEGCGSTAELLECLQEGGWQLRARWRSSIASFGLGASLHLPEQGWCQVPLALPMRTGLLDWQGEERLTLLPHCALELELCRGDDQLLVQWYQGTEGLCGWEPLNDQPRPWQNDRANGTVRYVDATASQAELARLAGLTEVVALVHNRVASSLQLKLGGYGPLGLCIDSVALLQQALSGSCDHYPLLLHGIWRQHLLAESLAIEPRLAAVSAGLVAANRSYQQALDDLPIDLAHHGSARHQAWCRLRSTLPLVSPFALVQRIQMDSPDDPGSPDPSRPGWPGSA